jgi:hypothetical protein
MPRHTLILFATIIDTLMLLIRCHFRLLMPPFSLFRHYAAAIDAAISPLPPLMLRQMPLLTPLAADYYFHATPLRHFIPPPFR